MSGINPVWLDFSDAQLLSVAVSKLSVSDLRFSICQYDGSPRSAFKPEDAVLNKLVNTVRSKYRVLVNTVRFMNNLDLIRLLAECHNQSKLLAPFNSSLPRHNVIACYFLLEHI